MEGKPVQSILVVDDDAVSRKKLCRIFQRLGFDNIQEAAQGDEALTLLKEHPVDLVMADWHMPELNGLELLKAIRAETTLRDTYVYLVTTEGRQAQIIAAVQAGATGYIMKPFSQESIKQKLGDLIPSDMIAIESDVTLQKEVEQSSQNSVEPEAQATQELQSATAD